MRSEKPADLLKLARALAASAEGMTLDEMAEFSKVGRRTVERRRDAIEDVFGPLDRIEDARQIRFRMNGRGLGSFAVAPTSEELAELENAVRACMAARDDSRAEILSSLHQKIRASLRGAERLRLDTDIDAQLRAEAFARQVGPRPYADPKILKTLREALLAGVMVKFLYGEGQRRRAPLAQGHSLRPAFRAAFLPRRPDQEQTRAGPFPIGSHARPRSSPTSQARRQRASILRPTPHAPSEFFRKKPRTLSCALIPPPRPMRAPISFIRPTP